MFLVILGYYEVLNTSYITGLHGSGAAKMKAEFRKKRANRHKNK